MPATRALILLAIGAAAAGCRADSASARDSVAAVQDAATVDAAWIASLSGREPAAAATLLDDDFEWTDTGGRTRTRAETQPNLSVLAGAFRGEQSVQHFDYSHIHVVTSAREGERMMRVWALRQDGWRAIGVITTRLIAGTTPFAASAGTTGDCDNPCQTLPFTPSSDNAKEIAEIFKRLKRDEWHPDPDDWSPYVLDDVYYVTETAQLSKADRVNRLAALKKSGAPSTPGDPVLSMRIHDFGDAAVMIARHTPYRGGDPYYSLRVWARRDGRWQLANTQQTVIRSTADVPAS